MHEKVSEQVVPRFHSLQSQSPPYTKSLYPPACHSSTIHRCSVWCYPACGCTCRFLCIDDFWTTASSAHRYLGFVKVLGLTPMFAGGPGIVNAGNAHLGQETLAESQWVHVLGKHVDSENMRLDVRTPFCTGWCQCKAIHGSKSARIGMGI